MALNWMIERERTEGSKLHPLYDEMTSNCGNIFYFNSNNGTLKSDKQFAKKGRGGILADQMGLGKTIMMLTLVFKQPSIEKLNFISANEPKRCCDDITCLKKL